MPTFPATFPTSSLLPVVAELYAGNDWRDVTGDVRIGESGNVQVQRGLQNEATSITPSQCMFTLDNRSGNYSPNNPLGAYYGSLGRNVPFRLSIGAETDTFTRTVSNGWGSNDSGDAYTLFWIGSNGASSFAVGSGVGTQTVTGTNAYVAASLANTYADVDVAVTVTVLAGVAVTGAQIEPANILLRGVDTNHYYMVRCTIQVGGAVTLQLMDRNAVALSSAVTATVTHTATSLRVRAQVEGQTLRAKVWDASSAEPAGWLVVANYLDTSSAQQLDAPGWVGIRSGVATGNTNTNPLAFSYDNLVIRVPRYAGWLPSLTQTADVTGIDQYMPVTAGSVLRQLNQGTLPVQSCLRHDIPSLPNLVAYWPCEDGANSTQLASAVPGGQAMTITNGTSPAALASDSSFACSLPLPVNNGSYWIGYITNPPTNGVVQVRALLKFPPAATLTDGTRVLRVHTTGTYVRYDVVYNAGGNLSVVASDPNGPEVTLLGSTGFNVDGQSIRVSLWIQQSGSNITGQLSTYGIGAPTAGYANLAGAGLTGVTIRSCYAVAICPPGNNLEQTVVGHITVENAVTDIFALIQQLLAFNGERAQARIARLCAYNGIEFNYVGDPTAKALKMGPQPAGNLLDLITSCVTTDGGLLYEAKGSPALVYRTAGAHANNTATGAVTLDAKTSHQLSAYPQVQYDDLNVKNDITVQQTGGSSFEAVQTTGPLSTAPPPTGVGSYATTLTVNAFTPADLADIASWALHLGTVVDARYPQVSVNLASPHLTSVPSTWWGLLGVDPDDFLAITGLAADQVLLLARGYTETFTQLSYSMTFNCGPGSPYVVGQFDDGISRLDSDTSTLHASINGSVTSFTVDVADGVLWTTSAADLPLDILVDGERMTVTNITGSSSPQTFTVTRAVNGISRGHGVGASVFLYQPFFLAPGGL